MDSPSPALAPLQTPAQSALSIPRSLFLFAILYGGMVPLGGFLGAKQVALGPLAVEAGIFPFLTLVAISSAIAELHGKATADRLVRFGFVPLTIAILLALLVLQLPTDPGMYPPAKEAFPIIVGQSWRMMAAGIAAYGVSVTLNIWIFDRLRPKDGTASRWAGFRGFIAAALSQIVDTLIFITASFWGVRPILDLMLGQMLAKVVLSAVLVPLIIWAVVAISRQLDGKRS
ncbi:queuosine precursor transporter [Novosphingobium sp. Gsoil 351]|uniref:queuosine precursor transporter n=1 Tax=Novosphingobium sp. Gsoil 351 TaxID=2675225 RepID=UPI0012B49AF8|nr:queuosine precursor transporter [Novosphingobium sp. Gsoil 351]QGN54700.1 queuosine precursor transporter [Novosphingobium sp. Gsoil 351]